MRHSELVSDIINGITEDDYSDNNIELPTDNVVEVEVQQAALEGEQNINAEEDKVAKENTGVEQVVTVQPVEEEEAEESALIQVTVGPETRHSARIAARVRLPERFVHASFIKKSRWSEELAVRIQRFSEASSQGT
jgi:hypothetical protein